jgi:hypothetical protein
MLFLRRYFSLYIPFLESCKVVCRSKDVEEFFAYNSAANVACSDSWKLLFALAFYSCFFIFFLSWEEFMRWTIISDGFLISWSHGTLLVESKLSSYLRTWPLYSTSLLGLHFEGTDSLNPCPLYGRRSVFVFGFPNTLAAMESLNYFDKLALLSSLCNDDSICCSDIHWWSQKSN